MGKQQIEYLSQYIVYWFLKMVDQQEDKEQVEELVVEHHYLLLKYYSNKILSNQSYISKKLSYHINNFIIDLVYLIISINDILQYLVRIYNQ